MDLAKTLFDVIDTRSFSNVWYWLVLAVSWSTVTRFTLGVPYDMVTRARRKGGEAQDDLIEMVAINVRRMMYIVDVSGLWLAGFWAFLMSALSLLAFWYGLELAQALALLFLPFTLVGLMTFRTARIVAETQPEPAELYKRLMRHRFWTHVIGMISVFITAVFGMYHNLSVVPGF